MLSREQIRERISSWVPKDMGKNFFHPQSPQNIKRLQFFWVGCAGLVIVAFSYGIVTFLFEKAPLVQQEDAVKVTPTFIETATKKMNMEEIFRHKIEDGFKQLSDKFANLESQILGESKRKQVQDDSYDQSQEPSQLFSQVMNDQGEDQVEDSKDRLNQELYKGLLEKELGQKAQKITVADEEMKAWYKNNPEIRTSHILIQLKPSANAQQKDEGKKRASEILEEVKKSKRSFEELVKLYSDDSLSKQAGGDVGWQSRVTIVPAYYDAALKAKVGEIVGLIETQFGFHIIKVTGRHSFEEANKRQIRAAVFDDKKRQLFDDYFEKLKKSIAIKTNPNLIK